MELLFCGTFTPYSLELSPTLVELSFLGSECKNFSSMDGMELSFLWNFCCLRMNITELSKTF